MKNVIFAAAKAYYMVRVPEDSWASEKVKIKPIHYAFEPCSLGFAFTTSDESAIKWIKEQDLFAKGLIWEMDEASTKAVQMGPGVVQGGTMSGSKAPAANVLQDEIESLKAEIRALLKAQKGNKKESKKSKK